MPDKRKSIRPLDNRPIPSGVYFITIVTEKRSNIFGEIANDEMVLSPSGQIVRDQWLASAEKHPNISPDEFIVMPNHFHGIVWVQTETASRPSIDRSDAPDNLEVESLSAFITDFKMASAAKINQLRKAPGSTVWQPKYYERTIQNRHELDAVREYIRTNPFNWHIDPENK
jgi:putative transposase